MEKRETIAKIIGLGHQFGENMHQHSFPHWMKMVVMQQWEDFFTA